jgi:hypothetical protein
MGDSVRVCVDVVSHSDCHWSEPHPLRYFEFTF